MVRARPLTRERFPDQLRGLALLGIVVVNAPFLAISSDGYTAESLASPLDRGAAVASTFLAEGKFYLLFSFLFGYSSNFIMKDGGPADLRRYRRRLVGLAVIGLAHAVFLFIGDILVSYAILGTGLLVLTKKRDRTVLRAGMVSATLGVLWLSLITVLALAGEIPLDPEAATAVLDAALADGSFLAGAGARLAVLPDTLVTLGSLQWGLAFAAFCTGLVAGRRHLLGDIEAHLPLFRRMAVWGLLLGIPLQAVATWLSFRGGPSGFASPEAFAGLALGFATAPILSMGYLGGLALLTMRYPRALVAFQVPGRASLTIYIGESLVLCSLFCGWGLGLFGTLAAAPVTAIAIATWAVLAVAIWLWLTRYRQGPLEALLATWTGRKT